MIWFALFLAGIVVVLIGLVKAVRSRKPDLLMANGGILAAVVTKVRGKADLSIRRIEYAPKKESDPTHLHS